MIGIFDDDLRGSFVPETEAEFEERKKREGDDIIVGKLEGFE